MFNRDDFLHNCRKNNILITKKHIEKLDIFYSLIILWQSRFNLIASSTISMIWIRHFFDCLSLLSHIPNFGKNFCDIGSGAGFPGVLISIFTDLNGLYIESNKKKALFLEEVINKLKLRARVINDRIENIQEIPEIDIVTARAVTPLPKLINLCQNLRTEGQKGQIWLFLQGRQLPQELKKKYIKKFKYFVYPNLTKEGYVLCINTGRIL